MSGQTTQLRGINTSPALWKSLKSSSLDPSVSLKQWAVDGWLRPHRTSREEINNLLSIVERDLLDAQRDISPDWRFGIQPW